MRAPIKVKIKVKKQRSSFDFAWVSWSKNDLAGAWHYTQRAENTVYVDS